MNVDCVVVDANLAFKALAAGRGDLRDRLGYAGLMTFYAPRFLFVELFKHKERLGAAARVTAETALCLEAGPVPDKGCDPGRDQGNRMVELECSQECPNSRAALRAARVWLSGGPVPTNATDFRIHRVMAGGGRGARVEFRSR
jgi:hypothetical protein